MDPRTHTTADGAMVFDADTVPRIDATWFDPVYWERAGALQARGGGRAAACFIDTPVGPCVLRHYHRGGMVANLLGDCYLWTGAENTRCFAEFRLLARLHGMGLPVPAPVAARYRRRAAHYDADLITRCIDHARTLADCLRRDDLEPSALRECGAVVARFHRHGAWHADLNAHNVLMAPAGVFLIDFDRGRLRRPARSWQQANLARLRRSLIKLGAARDGEAYFDKHLWLPLMEAYAQSMEANAR